MKFTVFAAFFVCGALATACTVNTIPGTGGAGGTGTTTSTKSATSSTKATTTSGTTNPTTTTGGSACDTGAHGSLLTGSTAAEQKICTDCIKCSQTDLCMAEWQAYGTDAQYMMFLSCNQACTSGDTACFDNCDTMYPSASAKFQTAISCSVCQECVGNCDAANSCTAGTGGAGSTGTGN